MKIKTIVSCIVMCILVLIGVQVNAALEASAIATCETEVEAGDTITLDLSVNITSAGTGVEAIMATVEYPSDIMEMFTATVSGMDLIQDGNDWIITPDEPITSGTKQVAKIKFTVKENISATSATIKITDIEAVDGDGTTKAISDITKNIKIGSQASSEATLTEIVITKPSKTTIKVGENLSVSDMKVTAKYSDGTTEDVTSYCKWYWDGKEVNTLNGQSLTQGKHTIKAVYEGKEDSFVITVEPSTTGGGSSTSGDGTTADKVIDKAGLEVITIPAMILAIAVAVISYKKYRMF